MSVQPEIFPDDSLDPVSLCRAFKLPMNTDSKPVVVCVVRQQNQTEIFPVYPFTLPVNIFEINFISQEIDLG